MVQLSHPYMIIEKTTAFAIGTSIAKVMSLLFIFFYFLFLFFYFTILYWFCHTLTWISHGCMYAPILNAPHPLLLACPSESALSALLHTLNLHWSSVSHMVIRMFQCYSLKSSHPRLFPQNPKVFALYLCLFYCLAYRVVITIFLNSIHTR